jgi:hypothetical protein
MVFSRSKPPSKFSDYRRYRLLLRSDFRFRCAYCLRPEYFLGGEAGCCIDHHRPVGGSHGGPDLINEYSNLYWCCRECNENKSDTWPDAELFTLGCRFIDPCNPEDDHDLHLRVHTDGSLEPLTYAGRFTCDTLKLWREQLRHYRAEVFQCQEEMARIRELLESKGISHEEKASFELLLAQISRWLEPPIFDRPRA